MSSSGIMAAGNAGYDLDSFLDLAIAVFGLLYSMFLSSNFLMQSCVDCVSLFISSTSFFSFYFVSLDFLYIFL